MESEATISSYVGERIRFFRKLKDYTLSEFADLIHKSKATVSKYEGGQIVIDVETLFHIAEALDVDVYQLIDYPQPGKEKKLNINSPFGNKDRAYVYYYEGRTKKVILSVLQVNRVGDDGKITCAFYMDIPSINDYEKCKYFYVGEMNAFDIVTYMTMVNQTNHMQQLGFCILNPMHFNRVTWGLMFGINNRPIAPFAMKFLLSLNPIPKSELTKEALTMSKNEVKLMKNLNMMVLEQESS